MANLPLKELCTDIAEAKKQIEHTSVGGVVNQIEKEQDLMVQDYKEREHLDRITQRLSPQKMQDNQGK